MGMTITEKIMARSSKKQDVAPGQIVTVYPDVVMSHDNASAIASTFKKIGVPKVWDPSRIVIPLDHCVPAASEKYASNHKAVREFVKEQGIENFYDINVGICHQVLPEKGHSLPGTTVLGSDSHTTTHGAFGAFAAGIGRSEVAAIWATGNLWMRVPESFKFNITGSFSKGVYAKDLALQIIGDIRADGANYKAVEFTGQGIDDMSIDGRMVLCNLSAEMGAKNGVVAADKKTMKWLESRTSKAFSPVLPDPDAVYEKEFDYDLGSIEPVVAFPHTVDNVKSISDARDIEINEAILGTCTNGRLEDLREAARILEGRTVAKSVRLLVFPASTTVLQEAMEDGVLMQLSKAGAVIMNPGCGPCLGAHEGVLAPGERAISTANRNFKGRMGCKESEIYLASPATVAASAVTGRITDPRDYLGGE